ncbi:MAG TPA: GSCFA domain-containing protein [Alphaproteobacteria bacterium]|nr:GSCFA domain-containing protein [Alphaproteobacteria bacterium]
MSNPYDQLPPSAFWRPAVAERHFSEIGPLWAPKFDIRPDQHVVTFGSCFAQHIGRALRQRGFRWLNTEPPPPTLPEADIRRFNYDSFSCRTGNIYTTSMLFQWVKWALLDEPVPDELWEHEGRWFDPFRPAIEPDGFASAEEALRLRDVTVKAFRHALTSAHRFVFTLGLTECWRNKQHGYEYPLCPGTAAGTFDPEQHEFHNLDVYEVIQDLRETISLLREANGKLRILLTVSPIPLVATNSGQHVMVATMESKSILRAAVSRLVRSRGDTDYFPSYEMINSPAMQGVFFAANRRQVSPMGVEFVMDRFFSCLEQRPSDGPAVSEPAQPAVEQPAQSSTEESASETACEEELLAAFAPGS